MSADRQSLRAIISPLQAFLRAEAAGGVLLLVATAAAVVWANAPGDSYLDTWTSGGHAEWAGVALPGSARAWVNDALMAVFFFVVALEIKRELVSGELADRKQAALPVAAALGGMVVPAAMYLAINASNGEPRGWGVPIATDIAFALGVLSLLGPRSPAALKVFVLALAIADDIGAIAVIAIFYADSLEPAWLVASGTLLLLLAGMNRAGIRSPGIYLCAAPVLWLATHESGVHATIAGVALALAIPARGPGTEARVRLEAALHRLSSYVIVPLFALANAGIALTADAVDGALASPVSLGVFAGLVVGKPLGVTLFSAIAVRSGMATLPVRVNLADIAAASVLTGIGFTVSIFVSELAFDSAAVTEEAKLAVLGASLLMGLAGYLLLRRELPDAAAEAP